MDIVGAAYKSINFQRFKCILWYFLFPLNAYLYIEVLLPCENYFDNVSILTGYIHKWSHITSTSNTFFHKELLRARVKYNRLISLSLHIGAFVMIMQFLSKKYYIEQLTVLAWTHVALLIVVPSSYTVIYNILKGIIWYEHFPIIILYKSANNSLKGLSFHFP